MYLNTIIKNQRDEVILIILWLITLCTINSYSIDFISNNSIQIKFTKKNLLLLIENIRFYIPFFIFLYLLMKVIKSRIRKDFFFIFFFIYALSQIFAAIFISDEKFKINDLQLIINFINVLFIFYLGSTFKKNNILKSFLFLLIIFIFFISAYFSTQLVIEYFKSDYLYIYISETLAPESGTLAQPTPRITGITRMLIVIFYFVFFFSWQKKLNIYLKGILLILQIYLVLIIYISQTRIGVAGLLIMIFFILIFYKENFFRKFFKIFIIIIMPILIFNCLIYLKSSNFSMNSINTMNNINKSNEDIFQKDKYSSTNRLLNSSKIGTSGRLDIWKKAIKIIYVEKIIFGSGPQSDRKILKKYYDKNKNPDQLIHDTNSSNAIIYSFLCAGFIGLISILFIYFLIIKKLILYTFNSFSKEDYTKHFIASLTLFLLLRSTIENGFVFFGIDFCIICACYYNLLLKDYKKI